MTSETGFDTFTHRALELTAPNQGGPSSRSTDATDLADSSTKCPSSMTYGLAYPTGLWPLSYVARAPNVQEAQYLAEPDADSVVLDIRSE